MGGGLTKTAIPLLMEHVDLTQRLLVVTYSKFSIFQSFKNVKVNAYSEYHNEST